MVNLVPFLAPQVPQAQVPNAGQAAVPGLFQALLLEALTGAQAAALPVPAQTQAQVQVPVPALPGAPAQQLVPQGQPVPMQPVLVPQMPVPQVAVMQTPVPVTQVPVEPQVPVEAPVIPGAVPTVPEPQVPGAPALSLPVEMHGADEPEDEAEPTETPVPAQPQAVPAEVAPLVQAQAVQPATQAPPVAQPAEPARPQTRTELPPAGEEPANPQLESFVQKAVRTVQEGQSAPETSDGKAQSQPTFQDLVKLVINADKARPEAPAQAHAPKVEEPAKSEAEIPVTAAGRDTQVRLQETPAAEAAPAPRQPVEPEQVIRQVSRFVKVMVDSKQSEVRLTLHPEHLGQIAVKLTVGEGALRAQLVAQDVAVKAALEANLDQLKTRLSDQGFQVEQVHVTVGGDSHSQNPRQGEQRQPQQPWRPHNFTGRNTEESDATAQPQRQTPAPWSIRGTGSRINSLV
ncbi:MAG TPA: flagellar hook-length control protein FliK [Symbiobacteriaceae bacterium]|nr:flagellar hook-length control protein FliK [Symbiobacteriaceae bacterium]